MALIDLVWKSTSLEVDNYDDFGFDQAVEEEGFSKPRRRSSFNGWGDQEQNSEDGRSVEPETTTLRAPSRPSSLSNFSEHSTGDRGLRRGSIGSNASDGPERARRQDSIKDNLSDHGKKNTSPNRRMGYMGSRGPDTSVRILRCPGSRRGGMNDQGGGCSQEGTSQPSNDLDRCDSLGDTSQDQKIPLKKPAHEGVRRGRSLGSSSDARNEPAAEPRVRMRRRLSGSSELQSSFTENSEPASPRVRIRRRLSGSSELRLSVTEKNEPASPRVRIRRRLSGPSELQSSFAENSEPASPRVRIRRRLSGPSELQSSFAENTEIPSPRVRMRRHLSGPSELQSSFTEKSDRSLRRRRRSLGNTNELEEPPKDEPDQGVLIRRHRSAVKNASDRSLVSSNHKGRSSKKSSDQNVRRYRSIVVSSDHRRRSSSQGASARRHRASIGTSEHRRSRDATRIQTSEHRRSSSRGRTRRSTTTLKTDRPRSKSRDQQNSTRTSRSSERRSGRRAPGSGDRKSGRSNEKRSKRRSPAKAGSKSPAVRRGRKSAIAGTSRVEKADEEVLKNNNDVDSKSGNEGNDCLSKNNEASWFDFSSAQPSPPFLDDDDDRDDDELSAESLKDAPFGDPFLGKLLQQDCVGPGNTTSLSSLAVLMTPAASPMVVLSKKNSTKSHGILDKTKSSRVQHEDWAGWLEQEPAKASHPTTISNESPDVHKTGLQASERVAEADASIPATNEPSLVEIPKESFARDESDSTLSLVEVAPDPTSSPKLYKDRPTQITGIAGLAKSSMASRADRTKKAAPQTPMGISALLNFGAQKSFDKMSDSGEISFGLDTPFPCALKSPEKELKPTATPMGQQNGFRGLLKIANTNFANVAAPEEVGEGRDTAPQVGLRALLQRANSVVYNKNFAKMGDASVCSLGEETPLSTPLREYKEGFETVDESFEDSSRSSFVLEEPSVAFVPNEGNHGHALTELSFKDLGENHQDLSPSRCRDITPPENDEGESSVGEDGSLSGSEDLNEKVPVSQERTSQRAKVPKKSRPSFLQLAIPGMDDLNNSSLEVVESSLGAVDRT